MSRPALETTSLQSSGYRGIFPRGKLAGEWSWPLTSAGVKNAWSCTSTTPGVLLIIIRLLLTVTKHHVMRTYKRIGGEVSQSVSQSVKPRDQALHLPLFCCGVRNSALLVRKPSARSVAVTREAPERARNTAASPTFTPDIGIRYRRFERNRRRCIELTLDLRITTSEILCYYLYSTF